jgi:IclR family acetate operon transcriptional repressor
LGLSHAARLSKLHHATAHRLLTTLRDGGLVDYLEDGKTYKLGMRLLDLAGTLLDTLDIREIARPTLAWLADASGETAHLATLDRDEMVFLDRVDGPQPVTLRTRVGFRAPVHATAVGKAFLAFMPERSCVGLLKARRLHRYTENTITDKRQLLIHLRQVRRQGYAVDNEEHRAAIRCVGAPVLNRDGRAVAAISVAGPTFRLRMPPGAELAGAVIEAGRRISAALGSLGSVTAPPEFARGNGRSEPGR